MLFIIIIAFLLLTKGCTLANDKAEGNWIVEVVDRNTGEKIDGSNVIVTDINKKFVIDDKANTISLPQKPNKYNDGKYSYGYTIITFSEGYLPRIDHNLHIGKNSDTNILIELDKPEPFSNSSYTEFFHNSSKNITVDFLNYYLELNR